MGLFRFFYILMIILTLIAAIYLMNPHVWAAENQPKGVPQTQTKDLMAKLLSHMDTLKPYMVSADKFIDKTNFIKIDSHLKDLTALSKQAAHDPRLQLPGYRISRQVLEDHIAETERVFRIGDKHYARWMLNSTLSVCMSCHTQIPTVTRSLKGFEGLSAYVSKFDQGEFLFATRAFDQAKDIFDELIIGYPSPQLKADQLETALERVITFYARVRRDPGAAIQALVRYQKNQKLPVYLKGDIAAWLKSFESWQKEGTPEFKGDLEVIEYARKNLDPKISGYVLPVDNPRAAVYLKVSGILYEYLQKHSDSSAVPELLYWLAICDKGLNNNFFFSLGDMYLKECIIRYPRSPAAKLCYDEYEQETIVSYSGSAGVNVPEDVKRGLGQLKALITSPPEQGTRH